MLLGLRTVIYRAPDLDAGKRWYTRALGVGPHIDQPGYVGFNVGGFELGLQPDARENTVGAYWGVRDITSVHARLLELGAEPRNDIQDVGPNMDMNGSVRAADVLDPFGNVFGIIETREARK